MVAVEVGILVVDLDRGGAVQVRSAGIISGECLRCCGLGTIVVGQSLKLQQ